MSVTTAQHMAARTDPDLLQRFIAAAEIAGVPDADQRVRANLGLLVARTITVNGEETTCTEVHAYAAAVRAEYLADPRALPPGANPGAVTDAHLAAAVAMLMPTGGGV